MGTPRGGVPRAFIAALTQPTPGAELAKNIERTRVRTESCSG